MAASKRCEGCGRQSRAVFQLTLAGATHVFDSLECATRALGRTCAGCGARVIGLGLIEGGRFFCSSSCARAAGAEDGPDAPVA